MLGHSMGSMLTAQYLYRWGYTLDAAVMSGSPGFAHPLANIAISLIASIESALHGRNSSSDLLQKLVFGNANKAFDAPGSNGYEWLSRDNEQVQVYVNDPLCGFVLSSGSMVDLFRGTREAVRRANVGSIPKQLPLYIFSGSDDPVHNGEQDLNRMLKHYRNAGVNPSYRLYPGGRHEMFNETNRSEVFADLISWLDRHLGET